MTATLVAATNAAHGTGYTPRDTIQLAGGTMLPAATLMVNDTTVVSIAVVAAGTGGASGTQVISGTTGTGTRFTASVVVSGGAITGTPTLLFPGDYTANPTALGGEPVAGGGLVGATVALTMGALYAAVSNAGAYAEVPTSPVGQLYSSGLGVGATWTAAWSGVTPGLFRTNFPAFADTAAFPDATVNFWLALAQSLLPVDRLTNMLDYATQLFMGHNLTVEAINLASSANGAPPGMSRGLISSESGAGVSVSFDTSSGIPLKAGHWALTTYGTRFLDLIRLRGTGPRQIGIGASPIYTGGAWAGPPVWVPAWFTA